MLSISNLLDIIANALKTIAEFLLVLLLGLVAALLIIMPWLMRALALIGWLAGTYLIWMTVNNLYSSFTPPLPLMALSAVPAILSSALVVWLFSRGQQEMLWGAMTLWGIIGWMVQRVSMLLVKWHYGILVIQILPAALSAVLLIYVNIHWGVVIRAKRLNTSGKS